MRKRTFLDTFPVDKYLPWLFCFGGGFASKHQQNQEAFVKILRRDAKGMYFIYIYNNGNCFMQHCLSLFSVLHKLYDSNLLAQRIVHR